MCEVCYQEPCDTRCPYAEQSMRYPCAECGEAILLGEECVQIDGASYHVACLEQKPIQEVLEICGYYTEPAGLQ